MIRLERVRLADGPGENRVKVAVRHVDVSSASSWEYLFHLGSAAPSRVRHAPMRAASTGSNCRASDLWVF